MFKNKDVLRGLGIGMFLAAVLIFIMQSAQSIKETPIKEAGEQLTEEQLTEEQLAKEAQRLGYKLYSAKESWYSAEELQQRIEEAAAASASQAEEAAPEPSYAFYISYRMSATEVAEMLSEMQLIDDKQAFMQAMANQKLTDRLQVGVFEFQGQPSMDDIILKITTPRAHRQ